LGRSARSYTPGNVVSEYGNGSGSAVITCTIASSVEVISSFIFSRLGVKVVDVVSERSWTEYSVGETLSLIHQILDLKIVSRQ
jgi:hypothetical protein